MLIVLSPEEQVFIDQVRFAMVAYFGADARRIAHADAVAGHARTLLAYIDADPVLTMTVAYLHDIGIHEAERRHGSNAGNFQELEGPPIARRLLADLGANPDLIEQAAAIVGSHHTPGGIDAPEFRVLWDADALVNFLEMLPGKSADEVALILNKHMVTDPGHHLAHRLFIPATDAVPAVDFSG